MYTDAQFTWSTTALISSGAAQAYDGEGLKTCRQLTFTIEKRVTTDTAVVGIEFARTSTSPFVRMGSTAYALASSVAPNECQVVQLAGPIGAVRPYVISKTASTTKVIVSLLAV
jgi:hypothetical protein